MHINLPHSVKKIIQVLEENGFEAFAVGGCVRDSLLGKEPKDWDITTSAKPEQVKALFHRTVDTGLQHGTVTVMINHVGYEVTTYRIDGEYEDGRHPREVIFTGNLMEDLKRRDFTINAMAYSDRTGIIDEFDGVGDLERRVIRCVGKAEERFGEDALRILRAVRFSAQLGCDIEEKTWKAICDMSHTLDKISRERIQTELDKLLMSDHPDRVRLLAESGIMRAVFGYKGDVSDKVLRTEGALKISEKNHYIRWAVFVTYFSEPELLKGLKFDNKTINICERLRAYANEELKADMADIRRLAVKVRPELFGVYYLPYRKALGNVSADVLEDVKKCYEIIEKRGDCLSVRKMAVNGEDLIKLGIPAGEKLGKILNMLFDAVLEDETRNNMDDLLKIAKKIMLI